MNRICDRPHAWGAKTMTIDFPGVSSLMGRLDDRLSGGCLMDGAFGRSTFRGKVERAFQASRTRRGEELLPQRRKLEKEVATFLDSGKHVLKKQFGAHWSPPMSEAGLVVSGTVATPAALPERAALLERMAGYLEAHPELEAPVLGVSAKAGKSLHQKLNAVRTALADQQREERKLAAEREDKVQALRQRLQGLVNELHQLLKPEDPRWHAFGIVPRAI